MCMFALIIFQLFFTFSSSIYIHATCFIYPWYIDPLQLQWVYLYLSDFVILLQPKSEFSGDFQDLWTIIVTVNIYFSDRESSTNQKKPLIVSPFPHLSNVGLSWPWPPQSQFLRSVVRKRPLHFLALKLSLSKWLFKKGAQLRINPEDAILWTSW
jgi:hypothetical protein